MDFDKLLVQLEWMLAEKISVTSFNTKLVDASADLEELESRVAAVQSTVNNLDDERTLVTPVQRMMDLKIAITEFQTKLTNGSSSITTIESNLSRLGMKMNNLEEGVALLL